MTGSVIEFPHMDLRRAREIVARPDLHCGSEILVACEVLFARGDRKDVRAVLELQRAGVVAGFEQAAIGARRTKARSEGRRALLGLYLLFAAAVGTFVIASWLFDAIRTVMS